MPADSQCPALPTILDERVVERALDSATDLVVLPVQYAGGVAIYPEASVSLVKEVRAAGVTASYLDAPDNRRFEVKKSALQEVLVSLVIGIGSNAAWEAIKAIVMRSPSPQIRVTYIETQEGNERRGTAWTCEGDTEGVIAAIDRLRGDTETPA